MLRVNTRVETQGDRTGGEERLNSAQDKRSTDNCKRRLKLAWWEQRTEWHYRHWKQFKTAFVAYWAEAGRRNNMAMDEAAGEGACSSQAAASGGSGKVGAAFGQPSHPPLPTLVTSRGHHHRVRGPPQRFKPPDLTIMRAKHQLHFENVACDVMCEHSCTLPECMNRVRTNLVRVAPSKLIDGEAGLFACEDIEEGTVVAGFGAVTTE